MGLFGGSKSSSEVQNDNRDQRVVAQDQGISVGANGTATVTTTNNSLDGEIQKVFAEMNGAVLETSSDAVKALAGFGKDALAKMGDDATNIYSKAESNSALAWGHTLDIAGDVLAKTMAQGKVQSDAANALATQAISAANPTQDQNQTMVKIAIAVAVAVAAAVIFKGGK